MDNDNITPRKRGRSKPTYEQDTEVFEHHKGVHDDRAEEFEFRRKPKLKQEVPDYSKINGDRQARDFARSQKRLAGRKNTAEKTESEKVKFEI